MNLPTFLSNDKARYERLQKEEHEADEIPLHPLTTQRSRPWSWAILLIALLIPLAALLGFVLGQRMSTPSDEQWLGKDDFFPFPPPILSL